jgi:hypothetical protein
MVFQIKKTSNHGTANPIVARLTLQTHELIQFCSMEKEQKKEVVQLFHDQIQPRVMICDEISQQITNEILKIANDLEAKGFNIQSNGRVIEVPYLINLEQRVEQYLYSYKSALRELSKIFNYFFGTDFNEARYDKILKWSKNYFGDKNELPRLLEEDLGLWIQKVIAMRNAVEHPSGYSGYLHIDNFSLLPEDHPEFPKVIEPTWHLNDEPAVSIGRDLLTNTENLLEFCEDILVVCMINKGIPKMLRVAQIPEQERDPSAPLRLRMVLNEQAI